MLRNYLLALFVVLQISFLSPCCQAESGQPKRQENSQTDKNNANTGANGIPVALHIECDPTCAAKDAKDHENDNYIARLFYKTIYDPLAILTGCLAIATFLLVLVVLGQLRDARETAKRQLRAYVGIEKIELLFRSNVKQLPGITKGAPGWIWPDVLIVRYRNFGLTPASRTFIHVNWQPIKFGFFLPDDFDYSDRTSTVYEGSEPSYSFDIVDRDQLRMATINIDDASAFKTAKNKGCFMYIYGHIDYTDIYDRRWQRNFCFLYEPWGPRSEPFVPHSEHNDEKQIS